MIPILSRNIHAYGRKMMSPRPYKVTNFIPGVNEHGLLLTLLLCGHLMSCMLSKFFLQLQSKAVAAKSTKLVRLI